MKKILSVFLAALLYVTPCIAADYYASPSGSTGDGSKGNPWGPSEIPWTTIDDATNTLYLFGGTYASINPVHKTTNRLTIRPCSASSLPSGCDSQVIINYLKLGDESANEAKYITIDGETTVGSGTRNIKFIPTGADAGVFTNRYADDNIENYLRYVEVTGIYDSTGTPGTPGCYSSYPNALGGVSGFSKVLYCYIHDNWASWDIKVGATEAGSGYGRAEVAYNTITEGTADYLVPNGSGVDIHDNVFDNSNGHCPYDIIHSFGYGLSYLRIWNNSFKSEDQMLFLEYANDTCSPSSPCPLEHIRIFNNTFEGVGGVGKPIQIAHQGEDTGDDSGIVDDVFIVNNTFVNTNYGIRAYGGSATSVQTYTNFMVKNNIGYNAQLTSDFSYITWSSDSNVTFDYNLIYKSGGYTFTWLDDDWSQKKAYTSIATFATDHPTFTHNVATGANGSDPLFVSSSDFRLQAASPAINAGQDLSTLTNMPTGWPFDKNGTTRTGTWDIGAYEYSSGGSAGRVNFGSGGTITFGAGGTITLQ